MLITNRPDADVEALRARVDGEVYGPGDDGWDRARQAWNLAADQRPAAVVVPASPTPTWSPSSTTRARPGCASRPRARATAPPRSRRSRTRSC